MKKYISILLLSILIFSCSKEEEMQLEPLNSDLTEEQILLKETSKLLGKTLTDKRALSHLKSVLKSKDIEEDQAIISFGLLFNDDKGLRKEENKIVLRNKYKEKSSQYDFKEAFVETFNENKEEFSNINNYVEYRNSLKSKNSSDFANSLVDLLEDQNLQIYYPYNPDFEDDDREIYEYDVTYDPLEYTDSNIAYSFVTGKDEIETVKVIDNDYLDENPVFVISHIDPCDLNVVRKGDCGFVDLVASNDPDPLQNGPVLLNYNVNHNNIPQTDIISTRIPRIQINGTSYMGFGGTHQKLRFFRVTGDGSITQNADGSISSGANSYKLGDFRCKRKFIKRKKRWLDIKIELDPDWNMSENTQALSVFSIHHISSEASHETSVKSGWKLEGGEVKPHTEVSGTSKTKVSADKAKFRANVELSRRQVLSTITGPGITGNEINYDGINYNVKKIGIIDYYLKHYYTDLTD